MSLFFKEIKPKRAKILSVWVDDPRYGAMIEDNVQKGAPGYTQLKYSDEIEARKLISQLCDILKLPKGLKKIEVEISFE